MTILLALLPSAGHDQLWLLLAAERMGPNPLAHPDPYGALVFESNPPLAIWLSAIVVVLSRLLHLSLTVTFKLSITLLAAASATVSAKLIRRLHPEISRAGLWFLTFTFIVVFGVIPARDFGQRDHILILLVLPYLLASALRTSNFSASAAPLSIPQRLRITLAASLGLALKPQQILIPIAVEFAVLFLRRKPRHPYLLEPGLFLLAAGAYFVAIHFLAPTYLTSIVPVLRDTYWAFGHLTFPQLLAASIQLHLLAAVTLTLFFIQCSRSPLPTVLLVAAVAATVAFYLQGTGWYYQQLPALTLFTFALALQLTDNLGAPRLDSETWVPRRLPAAAAVLAVLALALTTYFSGFHPTRIRSHTELLQPQPTPNPAFFANLPPGAAVATLTTTVDDTIPPAFRYGLTLAQRYPHLWMLPAILRNQAFYDHTGPLPLHLIPPARLTELDRMQHRFMVEDLTRWRPVLILVNRCQDPAVQCQVLEDRHDDLLAFFLRDPSFRAIFSHYHFQRSSGPYDAYTLNTP